MSQNSELKEGDAAPDFTITDKDKNSVGFHAIRNTWKVLYFYPKDNTPGCTLEAIDFTRMKPEFDKRNCAILAVSPDSPESHCSFSDKQNLNITMLSDPDHEAIELYGVWVLKDKNEGRYGVERSTFLVDSKNIIRSVWRKVSVNGHAQEVLDTLDRFI